MSPEPASLSSQKRRLAGGMDQLAGFGIVEPLCKSQFRLLLFLLRSASWFRSFLFFRLFEPGRDASQGDQLFR
jgi:hypothetical protein